MSVRDRIKAAEQASGIDNAQAARPLVRRGTKLSLNTDEHIKEEFLRRGDGGWHKKVDIGQHQKFVAPPLMPPVIKLTSETPLVTTPTQQLPGKVDLPKAFDMGDPAPKTEIADSVVLSPKEVSKDIVKEVSSVKASKDAAKPSATGKAEAVPVEEDWQRVARLEAEQQEAIDLAEGKTRHEEWDRVAALEAAQQAELDAAAILAEAEKHEADEKAKSKKPVVEDKPKSAPPPAKEKEKPSAEERHKEWDDVAAKEAKQQAQMDAEAILADLAKDEASKRKLDLEAEALLAEFEREEAAKKKVPGAFVDEPEPNVKKAPAPAPAPPKVEGKPKEAPRKQSTKDIPIGRFEDLLDEHVVVDETPPHSRSPPRDRKKSRSVFVEEEEEEPHNSAPKLSPREKILFDPIEYQKKKQARHERRTSKQQVKGDHHVVVEEVEEKPRSHARSVRSPSILLVHVNDGDDRESHQSSHSHRKKHRSRSRSHQEHEEHSSHHSHSHSHSQEEHRRSSSSLWPSFSNSERRSVSEMLDPLAHPQSSHHHRKSSDNQSTASARSEISVKKLEAVEYIAGKRLDHIPLSPPKSPTRPAGFVRSRSHTGEYSEGFTHDKKLLRKPSNEDEVVDHVDHDWEPKRKPSKHSRSASKDEPWQLKLLHEIARR